MTHKLHNKSMAKSEIRQNRLTEEWVIFAPARSKRPHDFIKEKPDGAPLPEYDPDCPFCPGNEDKLSEIFFETKGKGKLPWLTRVIPNKYPALTPTGDAKRHVRGHQIAMPGYGHHEVVIETPVHNRPVAAMSLPEVSSVIETYHMRYRFLTSDRKDMVVIIFRNHGERAGTSVSHPHSQIIAVGATPRHIRYRQHIAEGHYDRWGTCLLCDVVASEVEAGTRVLFENDNFWAFIPYAAEVPFQVWIVPRKHQADFGDVSEEEKSDLAAMLLKVLAILHAKLKNPAYNYVIHSAGTLKSGEPHLHWYLDIRPRLITRAGFEIGSGIGINPSVPEKDAEFLRQSD
ncbi:galactose-1-phosphate uridylyltransferase, family 1 [Desulfomonile tiedjei DSM 6799]|uniref:Galactose-1-phosphate uridylyltransferase n=2 Tax=Desulfomonile tiedjei TaxID=2358 RepID=I4C9D2_DESTA|nr:galactose-1-phosphate uridylyltransferase, family 1 [Desulfomonile tiedjei DSM 6799]